jgi:D-beta-D-heptose 7-phosphate kinase / D-beta-D-heptose 1-phosphate adenosyltransferase
MNPLVVIGDSLLDRDLDGQAERLAPDAPVPVVDAPRQHVRPGGAALAAMLAARTGREVRFVTALGDDDAGRTLTRLLADEGVTLSDLGATGGTGEKVRVRAAGRPIVRVDFGGDGGDIGSPRSEVEVRVRSARTILVSDYGRGMTDQPQLRRALAHAADRGARIVWDPHPRGATPTPGTRLVTPSLAEAQGAAGIADASLPDVTNLAAALRERWESAGVAVTLGSRGAVFVGADGTPLVVPARAVRGGVDPCGAGDLFAGAVANAIADGAVLSEAVIAGVRSATAFVAAGGASGLHNPPTDEVPDDDAAVDVVTAVRARGGTVVAAGGCFDLLHAGHVRLLAAARALGDCLIVCLNSDASVRRLKGQGRPVVADADRRAVLLGLAAVDAVVVFDEDTPERALAELRPDLWVKGADYAVADLPEADLLARWGGRAVVLPYLDGRSTSAMIRKAERHVRH